MSSRFVRYAITFAEEMGYRAYPEGGAVIIEVDDGYGRGTVDKVRVTTLEELGEVIGREEM